MDDDLTSDSDQIVFTEHCPACASTRIQPLGVLMTSSRNPSPLMTCSTCRFITSEETFRAFQSLRKQVSKLVSDCRDRERTLNEERPGDENSPVYWDEAELFEKLCRTKRDEEFHASLAAVSSVD